jgi:hypothetical protein
LSNWRRDPVRHRPLDPRRVKTLRSYSVNDIVGLYGVHPHTVRIWLKSGLVPIDSRRPTLILGTELHRFVTAKRTARKRSCPPGTIYCMKCREPRRPAGNVADLRHLSPTTGDLQGICPACESMMHRRVNLAGLEAIRGGIDVASTDEQGRIREGV